MWFCSWKLEKIFPLAEIHEGSWVQMKKELGSTSQKSVRFSFCESLTPSGLSLYSIHNYDRENFSVQPSGGRRRRINLKPLNGGMSSPGKK